MENDFSTHRKIIEDLYWKQEKTLPEVIKTMENDHGFFARPKSYKSHLKRWDLTKNISKKEAIAILQIKQRRLIKENKRTEFTRLGKRVDDKKLDRFARRQHFEMDEETPPRIRYKTPDLDPSRGPGRKVAMPFPEKARMELQIQQLKAELDKAREDIKSLEDCLYLQ
ncbi:Clr5 domain-containing protein [Chaetomium sp. MPI-CAGE-AT-0009]|nr:Clr5 domain-containing protein [Chaetomium sp. MPI-CAGE-AT-0009]